MKIFEAIYKSYNKKLPFVSYRKPNETILKSFFQKDNILHTSKSLEESGFVFAPFDDKDDIVLLPNNLSIFIEEEITITSKLNFASSFKNDNTSKNEHIKLIEKGITAIKNNQFKKVVLSRAELVLITNFQILETFQKLLTLYPTTMVYVWYHPKIGLWLGATPEILIKAKDKKFETMSLAGTQVYKENKEIIWLQKEINEQQFVTDYIVKKLKSTCKEITTSKTNTIKAGTLTHLQTKITGTHNGNISKIIKNLHPTPAVCGLPKEPAKNFIVKNENYNRSFYTGFLGELNLDNTSTNLFVNLRCMEVIKNNTTIFVGGGITVDSNSEEEWLETVAKTLTIKKVI